MLRKKLEQQKYSEATDYVSTWITEKTLALINKILMLEFHLQFLTEAHDSN